MPISSSSSSSQTSSSSSSSSEFISSSSSSGYCEYPDCNGAGCAHFSSWHIYGATPTTLPDQIIYVRFNIFGAEQQIELYSDPNYFNLISLGKGSVGTIAISDNGSSGISGTVNWDGTLVDFSQLATLSCVDASSSSSTSSIDSSSSSSESSLSTSSSSSDCCTNPYATGAADVNFSSWTLSGLSDRNSTNCHLWIGFDKVGLYQQIRIYKNSQMSDLVAIGQVSSSGSIALTSINSSGLTGTVIWNGTYVDYENVGELACAPFSSSSSSSSSDSSQSSSSSLDSSSTSSADSSSSSTSQSESSSSSSIDSSSSSSSSSNLYSSSSSVSTSSSSSESTQSSSSTSSIDSSSSSSESIGNVSSSSSSDLEVWNRSKPLILAHAAIKDTEANNEISQSIYFSEANYKIGKVFCYFYGPFGNVSSGKIKLSIYEADSIGKPEVIIATSEINASEITSNGWYSFDFDLDGAVPSSKWLSFSMHMEGLNEDNYVLWGHDKKTQGTSWIKGNGDWVSSNETRSLKISSSFEIFDLDNFQINSSGAIIGSEFSEIDSSITYPKCYVSVIIDSSGSTGWSDRFSNRKDLISKIFDKFASNYPNTFVFDYVKVGACIVDTKNALQNYGKLATINLDLSKPTRTSYIFAVSGSVGVEKNAQYTTNGIAFSILTGGNYIQQLIVLGEQDPETVEGTLTLVSGSGSSTIEYSSWTKASLDSPIIAYGYKNLEANHTYYISDMKLENENLDIVTEKNWKAFQSADKSTTFSLGDYGPKNTSALEVISDELAIIRKPLNNFTLKNEKIETLIELNDSTFTTDNPSNLNKDEIYDLVSGDIASVGHKILNINGNEISLAENSSYRIPSYNSNLSLIQTSSAITSKKIKSTTVKLLVKDVNSSRSITFFMQTYEGLPIEWDFQAFQDWRYVNFFWIGETGQFDFIFKDSFGEPLPDGTRLDLDVDKKEEIDDGSIKDIKITKNVSAGEDLIYVETLDKIENDAFWNIINPKLNIIEKIKISEKSSDSNGKYIVVYSVLNNDYSVDDDCKISISLSDKNIFLNSKNKNLQTNIKLPLVNVTPIVTGQNSDLSLISENDYPEIDFSESYENLNVNKEFTQFGVAEALSIDGVAVFRFLPITDDVIQNSAYKQKKLESILSIKPNLKPESQLPKNESDTIPVDSTTKVVIGKDYSIESPIYLSSGLASSKMASFATNFSKKEINYINYPGEIGGENSGSEFYVKSYEVTPSLSTLDENGQVTSNLSMVPFDVDFAYPDNISSSLDNKKVTYTVWRKTSENEIEYSHKDFPGIYASEGGLNIEYTITNKLYLVKNGTLNVKIYYNSTNLDNLASSYFQQSVKVNDENQSDKSELQLNEMNINTPSKINQISDGNGNISFEVIDSQITKWRKFVSSNSTSVPSESYVTKTISTKAYSNQEEWTLAKHYDNYDFSLKIINGKASFTLPENDTNGLLMIEASYFNETKKDFEIITTDMIFVANPISIEAPVPFKFNSPIGTEIFELGYNLKWKGGEFGEIEDGTELIVNKSEINLIPNISKSINGWAGGLNMGPTLATSSSNIFNYINLSIYHSSGYIETATRPVYIVGPGELPQKPFYKFYIHGTIFNLDGQEQDYAWTDGTTQLKLKADLSSAVNQSIIETIDEDVPKFWVGEFGRLRLRGFEQPNNLPQILRYLNQQKKIDDDLISLDLFAENKNIGQSYSSSTKIEAYCDYNFIKNDKINFAHGEIVTSVFNDQAADLTANSIPYPKLFGQDPLSLDIYIEENGQKLIRDGIYENTIVAIAKWKNKFINKTLNIDGAIINYPLPFASFQTGYLNGSNRNIYTDDDGVHVADKRGTLDSFKEIKNTEELKLNSYNIEIGLFRTDLYSSDSQIHTHKVEIDDNGNGITTSTISLNGDVPDHTHLISNFIVAASQYVDEIHSHELNSVAIAKAEPINNTTEDFIIQSDVIYDPTNCQPYRDEVKIDYQNRKAIDAVTDWASQVGKTKLNASIETTDDLTNLNWIELVRNGKEASNNLAIYYAGATTSETEKGFNIKLNIYFEEYVNETAENSPLIISKQAIPDGTKVYCSAEVYKVKDTDNILKIAENINRPLMLIKINFKTFIGEFFYSKDCYVLINSLLTWIPCIQSLSAIPDSTEATKDIALEKIESIGCSQIYDGIKFASQRAIQYMFDNEESDLKHLMLVLSDFDENMSSTSLNNSIKYINWINGSKKTPVFTVKTGSNDALDDFVAKKITTETNGHIYSVFNLNDSALNSLRDDLIKNKNNNINNSNFIYEMELNESRSINSININNFILPTNSSGKFRYKLSKDNIEWTNWSKYSNINSSLEESSLDEYKFINIDLTLYGNENFESPTLNNGFEVSLARKQTTFVYFQPIYPNMNDNQYLSSIHFTMEGNIPDSSTVEFGLGSSIEEYEWINSDETFIGLTRFNELLITKNYITYSAVNGKWNKNSNFDVYELKNGISTMVKKEEYFANYEDGTISFYSSKNIESVFSININIGKSIYLACKITNYKSESAVIDHIGVMYSIGTRIPRDSKGNIIYQPLFKRI